MRKGFTSIELIIVLAIIGIIIAVIIPFTGLLGPYEVVVDGRAYEAKIVYERPYGGGTVWIEPDGTKHISYNLSYKKKMED